MKAAILLVSTTLLLPASAIAKALPPGAEAMVRAAAAKGDPAMLQAVAALARETSPESGPELDALLAGLNSPAQAAKPVVPALPVTAAPKAPSRWKGAIELGGNQLDGKNEVLGIYGSADVTRTSGRWRHRLTARGDFQETNGRQTADRYIVGYEPRLTVTETRYAFGLVQAEHDPSLGYDHRYTLGGGLGLSSVDEGAFRLAMDIGPAVRITEVQDESRSTLSARGSLNLRWILNEHVTISQESSLFSDRDNTTAKSLTALDSRLYGPLKARVSYNVQYERRPLSGQPESTTATRASVLYSF